MRERTRALFVTAVLAGAAPLVQGAQRTVTVGSKAFAESHLLGEILKLVLEEEAGLRVEHKSGLGGTLICHEALLAGEIDLYPEYTGTAAREILGLGSEVRGGLHTFLAVQEAYRARFDLEWMQPFGMNNTYVLAMREKHARELGIRSLSDLARRAGELRGGFSIEFLERPDGLPGLRRAYGLELAETRGMEHALAYEALRAGRLDVMDAYSTDGKLLRFGLRQLVDDRGFFPPYHGAPVVRRALLEELPEVRAALDRLAFRLDDDTLRALNLRVEVDGEAFAAVARSWWEAGGRPLRSGERAATQDAFLEERPGRSRWRELVGHVVRHLQLSLGAVLLACAVAIPLGVLGVHRPLVARATLGLAGVLQTVPGLALLAILITLPGLGLSARSAIVALFLYALLPIARNTHTGLVEVDPTLLDAARGMGLTRRQILWRIRMPLAVGTVLAGVRTATVISVGMATLAAFIGAGGLGEPILTGIYLHDPERILFGAVPAAVLALGADFALGLLQLRLTPRGVRLARQSS